MGLTKRNRGTRMLAASLAALIAMATGLGGEARAATATETGFAVPGAVHRGNGQALHAPSGAGMPATGVWSNGASGSCTADDTGMCDMSIAVNRNTASVTFTVLDVTHATFVYAVSLYPANEVTIDKP